MQPKPTILIRNARIVNRGRISEGDVFIRDGFIQKIAGSLDQTAHVELDAAGNYLLPGIIDDQVHFREPGLTPKADIGSESRAGVAGGVTSFMEMPNTKPPALTQALLEDKYRIAAQTSPANYSFYMGVSNDNLGEVLRTDPRTVCGLKAFMGSSTGNMLVDDPGTLEKLFANAPMLIATHCEDEATVRANEATYRERYGEAIPFKYHPLIRSTEACFKSSSFAVSLAKKHNTRLHVLHISTRDELSLFSNHLPLEQKRITAELCVHHLFFNSLRYADLGAQIKCNPAIKDALHQDALLPALLDDRLDVVATDHAPHTWEEKQNTYFAAPSGLPLLQHSLNIMLGYYHQKRITLEKIVEKMCHAPAICFQIDRRGYAEEGYWADLCILDAEKEWTVSKANLLYKCGWSPLEGQRFKGQVLSTVVSGHLAYHEGRVDEHVRGERMMFKR